MRVVVLGVVAALSACQSSQTDADAAPDRGVTVDVADTLDVALARDVLGALDAVERGDVAVRDIEAAVDGSSCGSESQRRCQGLCTDVTSNDLHCGACDRRCGDGMRCERGACVRACLSGEEICGVCDDNRDDRVNCGV